MRIFEVLKNRLQMIDDLYDITIKKPPDQAACLNG